MELRSHRQKVQPLPILGILDLAGHALKGRWVIYYYLVSALKRRLIHELKDSFERHPVYSKIAPFIQNKYEFEERPQMGIVVKGSSANKVSLSGDNFIGHVESYVMLAHVGEPVYPLEWVREDLNVVRENGDRLPTPPGIYYLEILEAPDKPQGYGQFAIDPLITVTQEPLLMFRSGIEHEAQLPHPPTPGTVRLWLNRRVLLQEGTDYTVNYKTGAVTFLGRYSPNDTVEADFRYPEASRGPFRFQWNTSDFTTLPGVVMAFGKRAKKGDKVAIRISPDRGETAMAYGGRFEVSFDLDVLSLDTIQTEEIADLVVMYLWAEKKALLEFEGIEIVDISIGGESEDVYDETSDLNYYQASLSIQFRSDWEMHIPLPLALSKLTTEKKDGSDGLVTMGPSSLFYATYPIIVGRNNGFERIK